MAKKTKKPSKKINLSAHKKSPKKSQKKNISKTKQTKAKKSKSKLENDKKQILSGLDQDDYEDFFFDNDIENMPHDSFETYDLPLTEKENKEYIKKLIDDSDVILYLLDARDVLYFLDKNIENMINTENKLLIYVINKIDLVSKEYLKKISNYLSTKINNQSTKLFCSCLMREKIQELYDNLNFEILKFKTTMKTPSKKNTIVKIGIIGMPNVGKNSLIQSFELLGNSICEDEYINFDGNEIFCVNSVPGIIFGDNNDEHLISKKFKNVNDIPNTNNLIKNIFKYIQSCEFKNVYQLDKEPENLQELIKVLKIKFGMKNNKLTQKLILDDIISGKICFEINY